LNASVNEKRYGGEIRSEGEEKGRERGRGGDYTWSGRFLVPQLR
jgi:hypothetical protein